MWLGIYMVVYTCILGVHRCIYGYKGCIKGVYRVYNMMGSSSRTVDVAKVVKG